MKAQGKQGIFDLIDRTGVWMRGSKDSRGMKYTAITNTNNAARDKIHHPIAQNDTYPQK